MTPARAVVSLATTGVILTMAGCSTPVPKPTDPHGMRTPMNANEQALAELLEIARESTPRRYRVDRAVSVRQTMQLWAQTAGLELQWQSKLDLSTSGVVDEFDLRRALMALSQQYRNEQAALVVDLSDPRRIVVRQAHVQGSTCSPLPAGSIALGQHCLPMAKSWLVEPADLWLSHTLARWAKVSDLQMHWLSTWDWPIELRTQRAYGGDLHQALGALEQDLLAQGVALGYSLKAGVLSVQPKQLADDERQGVNETPIPSPDTQQIKKVQP